MAITVSEPVFNGSYYVPLFNPILFTFTATAAETKVIIQVKDSAGAIIQDNIILLFDSVDTVVFDASTYLKPQNSNALNAGQYTADINDTNSIVEFFLSWDEYPQSSPTSFEDTNRFYATNAVLQIGNPSGNNLYNEIPLTGKTGIFLTEFDSLRHWEGYPQTVSFISNQGGVKKITDSTGETLTGYAAVNSVAALLLPDLGESYTIEVLQAVSFLTSWNVADGNFTASGIPDSGTLTWVLPDGTEVATNSLNSASASFDGLLNTVIIIGTFKELILEGMKCSGVLDLTGQTIDGRLWLDDFSGGGYGFNQILFSEEANETEYLFLNDNDFLTHLDLSNLLIGLNGGASARCEIATMAALNEVSIKAGSVFTIMSFNTSPLLPTLDLSNFTSSGASATFVCSSNTILSSLSLFTGNVLSFTMVSNPLITSLDLDTNNIGTAIVNVNTNATLGTFNFDSSVVSLSSVDLSFNALTVLTLGGAVLDSTLTLFTFRSNGMSSGIVDALFIALDGIAVGGSTGTIRGDGTNGAVTATSATERGNLVTKGFVLIHN